MTRTDVVSSNVKSIGYDPALCMVEVEFKNGGLYQYTNVTGTLADEVAAVRAGFRSAGKYVLDLKREPLVECKKIEEAA
jgi:hypothetical protein